MNIQHQIDQFHIKRRKIRYEKTNGKLYGIKIHNLMHKILLPFIKLTRFLRRQKLVIVNDRRIRKIVPTIYACTHIGGYDVESLFEAIVNPCYLFLGDPREVYYNLDGLLLFLNGVICLDLYDKDDRYIAKQTAISLLKQGGSLMIFPEGAWNITENKPVMYLFSGAAQMAIASGADIIPVAVERYGDSYYVNIGENIECKDETSDDKEKLTEKLRDTLATLKWEIWERKGMCKRCMISTDYSDKFLKEIIGEKNTSYTVEDVWNTMYRPDNKLEY